MELRIGKEIEHIHDMVLSMATLTEESVKKAVNAFLKLDMALAHEVVGRDGEINEKELEIDKELFECLALKAPVARDLRFLFSIGKINKDLERIGDHAVNIAQAAINCAGFGSQQISRPEIKLMTDITCKMLSDAINSFITSDTKLALVVLDHDDQVDELNRAINRQVIATVKQDTTSVEAALELLRVSKNLERIADLSTNISEDIIFHAQAKDIKHRKGSV